MEFGVTFTLCLNTQNVNNGKTLRGLHYTEHITFHITFYPKINHKV